MAQASSASAPSVYVSANQFPPISNSSSPAAATTRPPAERAQTEKAPAHHSRRPSILASYEQDHITPALSGFPEAKKEDEVPDGQTRMLYSDTKISIKGEDFDNSLVFLMTPMTLTEEEESRLGGTFTLDLTDPKKATRLFSAFVQKINDEEGFIILTYQERQHEITITPLTKNNKELITAADSRKIYLLYRNKVTGHVCLVNASSEAARIVRREGRPRLLIENTDSTIRCNLQTDLINGHYDVYWLAALHAIPCGALGHRMRQKMLERSRLQGSDRWVTIGRNVEEEQLTLDGHKVKIVNDFDLGVLGEEISIQHGSLGITRDGNGKDAYVYMDDGSSNGTCVARRLERGGRWTVSGNFAIPRAANRLLTFVNVSPDIEMDDSVDALMNKDFSERILQLKKGQGLRVTIEEHGVDIRFLDERESKKKHDMPDAGQSFSSISITALGNGKYELSNSGSLPLEAVQLISPVLSYPGKIQVERGDRIVFSNLNRDTIMFEESPFILNNGEDVCFIVPEPYETLSLQEERIAREIHEIEKIPDRISDSADWADSPSVQQYIFDAAEKMWKMDLEQPQNRFADAARNGDIGRMKRLLSYVDINATTEDRPSTALILAIQGAHVKAVKWLLDRGADVEKASVLAKADAAAQGSPSGTLDLIFKGKSYKVNIEWAKSLRKHGGIFERVIEPGRLAAVDIDTITKNSPPMELRLSVRTAKIEAIKWMLKNHAVAEASSENENVLPLSVANEYRESSLHDDEMFSKYEKIVELIMSAYDKKQPDSDPDTDPDTDRQT